MKRKKIYWVFTTVFAMIFLFISACSTQRANTTADSGNLQIRTESAPSQQVQPASDLLVGIKKGNLAPDFSLKTIDGETFTLSDYSKNSKPVLLYFFATWCPYCYEDFTTVKSIYPEYKDAVTFLAIDLDSNEGENVIKEYQQKMKLEDIKFAKADSGILTTYDVTQTTIKYAIGRKDGKNGVILWTGSGVMNDQTWRIILNGLKQSE